MFVAENYICFYATVLGLNTKKVISIEQINDIKKETILGVFNNSIKIITKNQRTYTFTSFWNRDYAY
jgi:hypothetical protein